MDIKGKILLPNSSKFVFGNIRTQDERIILEVIDGFNELIESI